jgi:predicted ATP-grasp superfamily ATP-dependent carboligase
VEIWEKPESEEMVMIAGWRQWADAGSTSSGLPEYLVQQTGAHAIGKIKPDGFYLFQIPGTHGLLRPGVKFHQGFPEELKTQRNDLFYSAGARRGLVIFLGDEPHLDAERYVGCIIEAARQLGVKRIIGLGGVYGEMPYEKDRIVSCNFSLKRLRKELEGLAVTLTDYAGGASIGSYLCRRAGDAGMEYVGFYAFVPAYDLSQAAQVDLSLRIENDYMAWYGVMQRVNHMLRLNLDLADLEERAQQLVVSMNAKIDELDKAAQQPGIRAYMQRLSDEFNEVTFTPADDFWEEELRRLFDKFDAEDTPGPADPAP